MKAPSMEPHFLATVVGLLLIFPIIRTLAAAAANSSIVTTLPGFDGPLPFKLETGYLGVGDNGTAQLFYYFVESQRSPEDPLLFWIDGGPGCSSAVGLFYEGGPLQFTFSEYDGSLPSLHLNPYPWTQSVNVVYMDAPVDTGFSYSIISDGLIDDYTHSAQSYEFILKWIEAHPQYSENELYVGGDSYSGIPIPMTVKLIVDGIAQGVAPSLNLKGYILGNPVTDSFIDDNTRIPFAHRLSLISDAIYEAAKSSCNSDFVNIDENNVACITDVYAIDELTRRIEDTHVLEPSCVNSLPDTDNVTEIQKLLKERSKGYTSSPGDGPHPWCRSYSHALCTVWANYKSVQEALHVRPGTKSIWRLCNSTMSYGEVVTSVVDYHINLTKTGLRLLVFSGDHDMSIPHIGTQHWINILNLTLIESWRAWSVDGQTGGYTKKYMRDDFSLTFATMKGAGHFAAEYKIKEAAAMIERWMDKNPL